MTLRPLVYVHYSNIDSTLLVALHDLPKYENCSLSLESFVLVVPALPSEAPMCPSPELNCIEIDLASMKSVCSSCSFSIIVSPSDNRYAIHNTYTDPLVLCGLYESWINKNSKKGSQI